MTYSDGKVSALAAYGVKHADHVQDRRAERTPSIPAPVIETLRSDALKVDHPAEGNHYTPLKDAHGNLIGYAVFRTIGGKLRLMTILSKEMTPKGTSLGHVLQAKTAEYTYTHTKTMPDGSVVDIVRLNKLADKLQSERVPVEYLAKHVSRSTRSGFSPTRYETADPSKPLLLSGSDGILLDGRHRLARAVDTGLQDISVIRVPKSMIESATKTADVQTPLQPHQQRVVDRLLQEDQPGLVAMHGLGSGKTLTSIAAADALGLPADVVLPAALRANYQKELEKHAPVGTPETNIQSLENVSRKQLPLKSPFLIVDEAHRGRNPSKTQRALRGSEAKKRLLLTGSLFYNQPSDVAAPVNIAAGAHVLPSDPEEFRRAFISEYEDRPGFIGKLLGRTPKMVYGVNPEKRKYLQDVLKKYVDYHPGSKENFPTREDQVIDVPMGPRQKEIYDALIGRAPPWVLERVRSGLPPSKSEMSQLNRFLQGTRQVASSTAPYHLDRPPEQPKLDRAVAELEKTLGSNPRAKAIVYSNYLDAALGPYKEQLATKGIPYGEFTGAMSKAKRDQMVRDYNENKIRALLLSRAGGEGLDLKGTRLIQLLEPHWNEEALKQVIGRGIRYKSHEHLPEDERKVLVQRFISKNPRQGLAQRLHLKDPERSVEDYLLGLAQQKEDLNEQFRGLLR